MTSGGTAYEIKYLSPNQALPDKAATVKLPNNTIGPGYQTPLDIGAYLRGS